MAQINPEQCARRMKTLYDFWKAGGDVWGGATSFVVMRGPGSKEENEIRYSKSAALHVRLFEYELPDTVLVFLPTALHILTSTKKAEIVGVVKDKVKSEVGVDVVFHVKAKGDDGKSQLAALLELVKGAGPPVGVFAKEAPEGALCEAWDAMLKGSGVATVDVSGALAVVGAAKDEEEVKSTKRAAYLAAQVLEKFVLHKIEEVVDNDKPMSHSKLTSSAEEAALDPAKAPVSVKLKADSVELAFPFIIQSGGDYDLKWTAGANDSKISYSPVGVILCHLGVKYKSYCGDVGRTYLIDPPAEVNETYEALLKAHEAAIASLTAGAKANAAHAAATAALEAAKEGLSAHLPKMIGHVTGLEYKESTMVLNAKCEAVLAENTPVVVSTGLQGLTLTTPKGKQVPYALLISDTVLVQAGGAPPEMLSKAKVALKEVSYNIAGSDEEEEEEDEAEGLRDRRGGPSAILEGRRGHAGGQGTTVNEQRRKEKQDELGARKNEDTLRRLTEQSARAAGKAAASGAVTDYNAYKSASDVAVDRTQQALVQVDQNKSSILLPLYGTLVPFHIGTIKSITAVPSESTVLIRINFNVPGTTNFGGGAWPPSIKNPDSTYIREVSYRCNDMKHAQNVVAEVKRMKTDVKQRETEAAERATIVRQAKLELAKGKVHRLTDLQVRPALPGKGRKLSGVLECHANGFRYSTARSDERLDIIFSNIKHAFFQPSKKELVTLVHFHLHDPIMVGKKKVKDVQFYTEVMDAVQNLDGGRRSMYDPDEIEEEQREREKRNRINAEFQAFVKRVQDIWERDFSNLDLEFDIPFHELAFSGVPYKSASMIMPTVNCMVDLIETPHLVVTLTDIEVINLERVGFGLKNFDMAIVFKDFGKDVHRIDSIDTKYLDTVKEWLTSVGIKYYESKMNLNWKPILKTIIDDPQEWIDNGGWEFLNLEGSDSEDGSDEESEGFQPDEDGSDESDSDSEGDSDDESVEEEGGSDDDDDEDGSGDDDEEEEGLDWDQLEAKARKEDAMRDDEDEDDDDRRRKGGKGGKGAPPPPAKKPNTGGGGGGKPGMGKPGMGKPGMGGKPGGSGGGGSSTFQRKK